jgi:hypothetical protein
MRAPQIEEEHRRTSRGSDGGAKPEQRSVSNDETYMGLSQAKL